MKYCVKELVAVSDSRIVVQQAQGLINCNQPNLQRRLAEYEVLRKNLHSWELDDPDEIVHLRLVSRIPEKIMKPSEIPGTPMTDVVDSDQVETEVGSPDTDTGIPESLTTAAEALMVMN
ncbi:hypothetical protein PHMEG_00034936 [Phytophthora megakarya]|uniref:RNase H type-1 domain-containing protein n=1 Tax=Phytophthora megakarya TaxID=4795 RepID=A0A225UQA4_9STRA|nr:hypothetical protein PHMEG_00034936 [Phytophthora megakarya]